MSKSLKRVRAALEAASIHADILEMPNETRTAADAAREAACEIDQIAKSIIFRGEASGTCMLFITARRPAETFRGRTGALRKLKPGQQKL